MSLSENINRIKRERGMNIDDICLASGVPKGTLSKITAGITSNPNLDTVKAIAKALKCSLDDLDSDAESENIATNLDASERDHIKKYRQLNEEGQQRVDDYTDDLINGGRYKKGEAKSSA